MASPSAASIAAGAIASGRPLPKASSPVVSSAARAMKAPSDGSLVAGMASRLAQVERLNQHQATKIARQSQEIDALRAELARLGQPAADVGTMDDREGEAGTGGASSARMRTKLSTEEVQKLRDECDHYKQQAEDMTKFLADYGLTWVGEGDSDEGDGAASSRLPASAGEVMVVSPKGSGFPSAESSPEHVQFGSGNGQRLDGVTVAESLCRPPPPDGISIDIQVMESRMASLNTMVEKGAARIVSNCVGGAVHARLLADDTPPLPLTFFRDGVKLGDHAFQPYDTRSAQHLIRDILDGYFPYALKDEHPDGVGMKVVDRTGHAFQTWLHMHADDDMELLDGGDRLALAAGRVLRKPCPAKSAGSGGGQCDANAERFLAKLPKTVIRNGKITEVRAPIAQQLGRGSAGARGVSAPAPAPAADRQQSEVSLLDATRDAAAPCARLQVKLESGQRVVLVMEPAHSVGALEDALDRWREGHGMASVAASGKCCSLRTAFPPKTYTDKAQSLQDAGLSTVGWAGAEYCRMGRGRARRASVAFY